MSFFNLPLLVSLIAVLISCFSFFHLRSYLKRRTDEERIPAELREEVNNILKSINEATYRDISLIEEREKKLKILLEDTDKRLKIYIRSSESREQADNAYRELGKNRYRIAAAETVPEKTVPAENTPVPEPPPEAAPVPKAEQINTLVKAGISPPLIASRLGISIAEAECAAAILERREN